MAIDRTRLVQATLSQADKDALEKLAAWQKTTPTALVREYILKGLEEAKPALDAMAAFEKQFLGSEGLAESALADGISPDSESAAKLAGFCLRYFADNPQALEDIMLSKEVA